MSLRDDIIRRVNDGYAPEFRALRAKYDSGEVTLGEWEALAEPVRNAWEDEMDRELGEFPGRVVRRATRRVRGECPACGRAWSELEEGR